jgi:hypothetical protein
MTRKSLSFLLPVLSVLIAGPAVARINMIEPYSPGLDFRIPKETWNHDAHAYMLFGRHSVDLYGLGYILTTPVSPDWEVGGGLDLMSVHAPSTSESGLGDIRLGAKYKAPRGVLPPAFELFGEGGLTLPTGDPDKGLGAGGLGLFTGAGIQGALADNVTAYSHLGARVYTKGRDTRLGNVIEYSFGIKDRIDTEWIAAVDVRGFSHGKDEHKGFKFKSYDEVYLAPGVIYRPKTTPAEFDGTLLLGLTDDSFDFGLQFAAKF